MGPNPNPLDYVEFIDKNAYNGFGAIDIDTDATAPSGLSVSDCQDRCTSDYDCSCVTYERDTGKCWRRKDCEASEWTSDFNAGYNVYLKINQPTPMPTPVPTQMPTASPTAVPTPSPTAAVMPSLLEQLGYYQLNWRVNTSYCMSVTQNSSDQDAQVVLATCAATLGQFLRFGETNPDVGNMRSIDSPEFCFSVAEDNLNDDIFVGTERCNSTDNAQTWTRHWTCMSAIPESECTAPTELSVRVARGDFVMIRSAVYPDKCMGVTSSWGLEGEALQLTDCSEYTDHKTWTYSAGVVV